MSSAAGFSMEIGSCVGIWRAVPGMDQFNGGGSSVSRTARRRTSGGRGSRSGAWWTTKRDRSMPHASAAQAILCHSASLAITARWRRPPASSFIAAIRMERSTAAGTQAENLGFPQGVEDCSVQELVAQPRVEALDDPFSQGGPGSMKAIRSPLIPPYSSRDL